MPAAPPSLQSVRLLSAYAAALVVSVVGSGFAGILLLLPKSVRRERLGRSIVGIVCRVFVRWLRFVRVIQTDLEALAPLRDGRGEIIAPNHPSLIDAIILFAALPQTFCLVKEGVMRNPLLGPMARAAGFISNDAGGAAVGECARRLRQGETLVLFPEGTRTVEPPLNPLHPGFALIARRAGAPIQTLLIRQDRRFLGKRGPFVRMDVTLPVLYTFALGPRFEPSAHAKARELSGVVETSLRSALNSPP